MAIGTGRRKFILALGGATFAWSLPARAQQPVGLRHVGVLMVYPEVNPVVQGWLAAFREGLGRLGWTEGQNIKFEYRWVGSDPNLMQQATRELVGLQLDLIISSSSPTTALLLQQTRTI